MLKLVNLTFKVFNYLGILLFRGILLRIRYLIYILRLSSINQIFFYYFNEIYKALSDCWRYLLNWRTSQFWCHLIHYSADNWVNLLLTLEIQFYQFGQYFNDKFDYNSDLAILLYLFLLLTLFNYIVLYEYLMKVLFNLE